MHRAPRNDTAYAEEDHAEARVPSRSKPPSAAVDTPRPFDDSAPIEPEILQDIVKRARLLVEKRKFRPDEYEDLVQEMSLE